MIHSTMHTWNVAHKRVFLRADLNVPLEDGKISNDFRLQSILPTIDFLLERNAHIVLATHIGKPTTYTPELSTHILIAWFAKRGYSIMFEPNIMAISQRPIIAQQIILMENLRFFTGENNGDPLFAKQLAHTAQFYVNDAFGDIHRADTSVALLPFEFRESRRSIGLLIEKELRVLNPLRNNPQHPFVAIIGGGKIKDKIPLIYGLLDHVNTLLLCPAICFSFLKALGKPVGNSLVDDTTYDMCRKIILEAEYRHIKILFPIDYQVAKHTLDGPLVEINAQNFSADDIGISIGQKTLQQFIAEISQAKTVFLNCAMGFAEKPETRQSTYELITAMAKSNATTIIAGGDSINAVFKSHAAESIDHLSTGGGAALAYLSGKQLPGLVAFEENFNI